MDCLEFENSFGIGINEEVGGGGTCDDCSCAEADCVLESSNRGGADGNDAARHAQNTIDG